jgi:EmrB/QacA subfamily drug resistance transporter
MRIQGKNLVLASMIFAVAMLFIDQTIVALAIPSLQDDLHLSATGAQWVINGYLLALSALFALGGKVADVLGHRTVVLASVITFAVSSALCGATPDGSFGETWLIFFRVVQGGAAAFLFPSALAIVIATFPLRERGRAMAAFFGITGGLTGIGPFLGGFLSQWTWRSIFWINIPVAIIAVVLIVRSKPENAKHRVPIDWPGAALVSGGMALAVLGLQQAAVWGWDSVATWACIVVGVLLLGLFVRYELRAHEPLVPLRLFADKGFRVDNMVLFLLSICFVPLFFFASLYAQVALGESASNAGLFLLVFFGGFVIASQQGGRILDRSGARPTVVLGSAIAAVGFFLWAQKLDSLSFGSQWWALAIAGAGVGMVLGPVSTDAINRAASTSYGAVTGVTQTVRNFAGSLGLAVLGSILITETVSRVKDTLGAKGVPAPVADRVAHAISGGTGGGAAPPGTSKALLSAVQLDFAHAVTIVVYVMAGAMALAFLVALVAMPKGVMEAQPEEGAAAPPEPEAAPAPTA